MINSTKIWELIHGLIWCLHAAKSTKKTKNNETFWNENDLNDHFCIIRSEKGNIICVLFVVLHGKAM